MKKILLGLTSLSLLFAVGCSNSDTSSSSGSKEIASTATGADSMKVVAYTYDKFVSKGDVQILDADTSVLSIDKKFATEIDSVLPKEGNVIAVWDGLVNDPFYVRVVSVEEDGDRVIINANKASAFDAIPDGDYSLSSEIFYDLSEMDENDEENGVVPAEVFFNSEAKTYHPVVILNSKDLLESDDENSEDVEKVALSKNGYDELLESEGIIDMREQIKSNWSVDKNWNILQYDFEMHPGVITIPGLGVTVGDYQGSWLSLFGGMEKLEKAYVENSGNAIQGFTAAKAYVRIDTMRIYSSLNFHFDLTTSWGVPATASFYVYGNSGFEMSNYGFGMGAGFTGEKYITHFQGKSFTFFIGCVPIRITIKPNFVFKYNGQAYGMMNYNLQYKSNARDTIGFSWNSDKGVKVLRGSSSTVSYNSFSDLEGFLANSHLTACGNASGGFYLRIAALLYGVAGPTVGIGIRGDAAFDIGGKEQFDNDGKWTGVLPARSTVSLKGAIALEAGAEISILGKKLFSRSWDVWDIKPFSIYGDTTDYNKLMQLFAEN